MSDSKLHPSIKETFSQITKHSQNPSQAAFIMKLNQKDSEYVIEEKFSDLSTVEDVAEEFTKQKKTFPEIILLINSFYPISHIRSHEIATKTPPAPPDSLLHKQQLEDQCPRYVVLYWRFTKDDRESYSVVLIHFCPPGSPPQVNMMMSRSKQQLIDFFRPNRILEVRDSEDLTDEFLEEALLKN